MPKRRTWAAWAVGIAFAIGSIGAEPLPVEARTRADEPTPPPIVEAVAPSEELLSEPIVSEPASYDRPRYDAGYALTVDARCSRVRPRGIDVTLSWQLPPGLSEPARVDLSKRRDGFAQADFTTSDERPVGERAITVREVEPGVAYYWRLLSKTPAGWAVRGVGRFEAPVCPADSRVDETGGPR